MPELYADGGGVSLNRRAATLAASLDSFAVCEYSSLVDTRCYERKRIVMFKTYISGPTTIVLVLLLLTGTTLLAAPQATTQQELLQQLQRGIDELQQGNLEK
ncbi:MAG: hypothetical protein VX992_07480, partial [Acidobacteriota bacterium]|nr:hypothetical protein [Acidobacteriota bacterium]